MRNSLSALCYYFDSGLSKDSNFSSFTEAVDTWMYIFKVWKPGVLPSQGSKESGTTEQLNNKKVWTKKVVLVVSLLCFLVSHFICLCAWNCSIGLKFIFLRSFLSNISDLPRAEAKMKIWDLPLLLPFPSEFTACCPMTENCHFIISHMLSYFLYVDNERIILTAVSNT